MLAEVGRSGFSTRPIHPLDKLVKQAGSGAWRAGCAGIRYAQRRNIASVSQQYVTANEVRIARFAARWKLALFSRPA
jgi:hypothetical protein